MVAQQTPKHVDLNPLLNAQLIAEVPQHSHCGKAAKDPPQPAREASKSSTLLLRQGLHQG